MFFYLTGFFRKENSIIAHQKKRCLVFPPVSRKKKKKAVPFEFFFSQEILLSSSLEYAAPCTALIGTVSCVLGECCKHSELPGVLVCMRGEISSTENKINSLPQYLHCQPTRYTFPKTLQVFILSCSWEIFTVTFYQYSQKIHSSESRVLCA